MNMAPVNVETMSPVQVRFEDRASAGVLICVRFRQSTGSVEVVNTHADSLVLIPLGQGTHVGRLPI